MDGAVRKAHDVPTMRTRAGSVPRGDPRLLPPLPRPIPPSSITLGLFPALPPSRPGPCSVPQFPHPSPLQAPAASTVPPAAAAPSGPPCPPPCPLPDSPGAKPGAELGRGAAGFDGIIPAGGITRGRVRISHCASARHCHSHSHSHSHAGRAASGPNWAELGATGAQV